MAQIIPGPLQQSPRLSWLLMIILGCFLICLKSGKKAAIFFNRRQYCLIPGQQNFPKSTLLALLHSERPKLHGVLAALSAIGLRDDPYRVGGTNKNGSSCCCCIVVLRPW